MARKVILFELNEVPWRVVDDHVARAPAGPLATALRRSHQYVTVAADAGHLSPWRTWPTVHRGVPDERHRISALGQDNTAADRAFPPVWQLLHAHGASVGVCGSLHSAPAPDDLDSYAFYLPDAFAVDDRAHPRELSRFQAFNLAMTRASGRNVDASLPWRKAAALVASARGLGIRPSTYRDIAVQLAAERIRRHRSTRRRTFQAVLAFDVFMSHVERTGPDLSTFFSNHVASAMHRYWAAAYPEDYAELALDGEWVANFRDEVPWAMGRAERMLARLVAFADAHPEYQIWTSSSMGQRATTARALETAVYLVDVGTFMRRLGMPDGSWRSHPAMLPQTNVTVREALAETFERRLAELRLVDRPLRFRRGDGGFFSLDLGQPDLHARPTPVRYAGGRHSLAAFGMKAVQIEDRSDTTAYHVPEGLLFVYDPQQPLSGSLPAPRPEISTLEIAPALLTALDAPRPDYMSTPTAGGLEPLVRARRSNASGGLPTGNRRAGTRRTALVTTLFLCGLLVMSGCSLHRAAPTVVAVEQGVVSDASTTAGSATGAGRTSTRRLRGSDRWRLRQPARDGQIAGYTTRTSAAPGVPVDLRVSTTARRYQVTAYRIGGYRGGTGRMVWQSDILRGRRQVGARFADAARRTVHADWAGTSRVDTRGWDPGVYVFKLSTPHWQAHVPYIVRSPSVSGRVVMVAPVTTWQAYNDWGGYSLYTGPSGDRRAWAVSFDRPYPAPGSGELLFGVVPLVVAAERARLPLAYLTNLDLHTRRDPLRGARAYVSMGHDEYWTPRMRRVVEQARDDGVNLAFFGANTMYWRIRIEDSRHGGRVVVGYRSDAHLDPVSRERRRTGLFRDAPGPRAGEHRLTGMQYECFPVDAPYRVVAPGWWGFRGTGVGRGQAFPHLVGVEADRVYPVPGTPRPMQVLSHASYSCGGVTTSAQSVYYTTRSAAGVFNAGTLRWTCALTGRCAPYHLPAATRRFVRQVTVNVLREFSLGPAALRHPAVDTVDRFGLPSVNQVPAS
jgi:hypothetical protein